MPEIIVKSINDLPAAAEKFCDSIANNRIFLFYGEMGAGKTTFIKEICKYLDVQQEVTSPTFAIVNEYECEKYSLIFHFDFYRIKKISEIFDIGFDEYIDSGALVLIEWPEMLGELIPDNHVSVKISLQNDSSRLISW